MPANSARAGLLNASTRPCESMTSAACPVTSSAALHREFLGLVVDDHEREAAALLRHVLHADLGCAQSIADLNHAERRHAARLR